MVFSKTVKVDILSCQDSLHFLPSKPIGSWMTGLLCLLPLQIATTRSGQLLPLKDGIYSNVMEGLDLAGISRAITFGWLESIFTFYGKKKLPIKVLSVMGAQSTGKSFMINHIAGTHFDGNAMRCTEGVWMSVRPTIDTIYVCLDYEGLGSVERSPQEDMLLSLLNAGTSHLILYKTNLSLGRSMSELFQMFQDGVKLFDQGKNDRLFKGHLFVQVNDVSEADRYGIVQEFQTKLANIVQNEGDDNFITRLFQKRMNIEPWPLFSDSDFYSKMKVVRAFARKIQTPYMSAVEWREDTKMLLAKLMICDWGSIDDDLIESRMKLIMSLLPTALKYGCEDESMEKEPLRCRDSGELITESEEFIDLSSLHVKGCRLFKEGSVDFSMGLDTDRIFPYEPSVTLGTCIRDLVIDFSRNVADRKDAKSDQDWFLSFKAFIGYFVSRRLRRVQEFVDQNFARFPEIDTRLSNTLLDIQKEVRRFESAWTLCGRFCSECELRCLERDGHDGLHHCGTDHRCYHLCEYIESHGTERPVCKSKAGHRLNDSGRSHACDESGHFCGQPCIFKDWRNCQQVCTLELYHSGDEHFCKARAHFCDNPCSLQTKEFKCSGRCVETCEDNLDHSYHRCENRGCPVTCVMPGCTEKCGDNDHFHDLSLGALHICGKPHRCEEDCQSQGVCDISTQPEVEETLQRLKYGALKFTKYTQVGKRLKCYKVILPGQTKHEGVHSHCENDFHFCEMKCPFCNYFCTLPIGHRQEHSTSHGNMSRTKFTLADGDGDFEYENQKFSSGDSGIAFLCSMYCKQLGRHSHIDFCPNPGGCLDSDHIRHLSHPILPDPLRKKEQITHSLFWKRAGFQDPYSMEERERFTLCEAECAGEEHKNGNSHGSSCTRPMFHKPLAASGGIPRGIGHISIDGHHFECQAPVQRSGYHLVFVIDKSGSMESHDIQPQRGTPYYAELSKNRYGAALEACCRFVDHSLAGNICGTVADTLSLVVFHDSPQVLIANQAGCTSAQILQCARNTRPNGGTNFNAAIERAQDLVLSCWVPGRIPVVIFLSDGESFCNFSKLKAFKNICLRNGHGLRLFTVLFSSTESSPVLAEMAQMVLVSHNAKPSESAAYGGFFQAIDGIQLSQHFVGVAKSLLKSKPSLISVKRS
ncbi:hypothetical protein BC829DRAFT_477350 [Chytridium lagenaria]|nr:hypothetical protein BC829DRAFT_477350 [Chytridium lagenaria]